MRTPLTILIAIVVALSFSLAPVAALPSLPQAALAGAVQPGVYRQVSPWAPSLTFYNTLPDMPYYQLSWQEHPGAEVTVQGMVFFVTLPCTSAVMRLTVLDGEIRGPNAVPAYVDFVQPSENGTAFSVMQLRSRNLQEAADGNFFYLEDLPSSTEAPAVGCNLLKGYTIGKPLKQFRRAGS